MSAGIPGLGLGGLFYLLTALFAPVIELGRTLRGRSSRAAWRGVGRQFAIALTMIVAVDLALRAVLLVLSLAGLTEAPPLGDVTVLPLMPIGLAAGLLAVLLATAKGLELVVSGRRRIGARVRVRRAIRRLEALRESG